MRDMLCAELCLLSNNLIREAENSKQPQLIVILKLWMFKEISGVKTWETDTFEVGGRTKRWMTEEFQTKFLDFQIAFVSRSNMKSNLVTGSATAFASFKHRVDTFLKQHQEPKALQDDLISWEGNII